MRRKTLCINKRVNCWGPKVKWCLVAHVILITPNYETQCVWTHTHRKKLRIHRFFLLESVEYYRMVLNVKLLVEYY